MKLAEIKAQLADMGLRMASIDRTSRPILITAFAADDQISDGAHECPYCLTRNTRLYGNREVTYKHTPMSGKPVDLLVTHQRVYCKTCGKTSIVKLDSVDDRHRISRALLRYIVEQTPYRTRDELASEIGIDYYTIYSIFLETYSSINEQYRYPTPNTMGIVVSTTRKPLVVAVNLENGCALDCWDGIDPNEISASIARLNPKPRSLIVDANTELLGLASLMPVTVAIDALREVAELTFNELVRHYMKDCSQYEKRQISPVKNSMFSQEHIPCSNLQNVLAKHPELEAIRQAYFVILDAITDPINSKENNIHAALMSIGKHDIGGNVESLGRLVLNNLTNTGGAAHFTELTKYRNEFNQALDRMVGKKSFVIKRYRILGLDKLLTQ